QWTAKIRVASLNALPCAALLPILAPTRSLKPRNPAMSRLAAGCLFVFLPLQLDADPPVVPKGQRLKLTDGQLFVPEGVQADRYGIELTLPLPGSAAVAEKQFAAAGRPGVLVSVVLPGLSSVYTERFKNPRTFQRILDEAGEQLSKLGVAEKPRWRRVV